MHKISHPLTLERYKIHRQKKVEEEEEGEGEERRGERRKKWEREKLFDPENQYYSKYLGFAYYKSLYNIIHELMYYRFVTFWITLSVGSSTWLILFIFKCDLPYWATLIPSTGVRARVCVCVCLVLMKHFPDISQLFPITQEFMNFWSTWGKISTFERQGCVSGIIDFKKSATFCILPNLSTLMKDVRT